VKTLIVALSAVGLLTSCISASRRPAADSAQASPQERKIEEIAQQIKDAHTPDYGAFQNLDMKFTYEQFWKIATLGSDKPEYSGTDLVVHTTNLESMYNGTLKHDAERNLTTRTDVSNADFRRVLHPNGICLKGVWKMDDYAAPTYTGYFQPLTQAGVVARASTHGANALVNTEHYNSFGFVGKIFLNQEVESADFITQTDLGGVEAKSFFQSDTMNAPPVSPLKREQSPLDGEITKLLVTGAAFREVDSNTSNRQVYTIAELGKGDEATRAPQFMKFAFSKMGVTAPAGPMDFRKEVMGHIPFTVEVQVSEASGKWNPVNGRKLDVNSASWRRIGEVTFTEATISHACDFRIQFHHAPWRKDLNKPGTEQENLRDSQ
jgi:hypothetical protein